jgi:hypothetical protein
MTMKTFKNQDGYKLTHAEVFMLRDSGRLNLGVNEILVQRLTEKGLGPKTTARAAYKFWTFVAGAVFIYSIYLSFTKHWWYFIVGFLLLGLIQGSNNKGNVTNYLDAAIVDKEFYDNVLLVDGWMYQIDETEVGIFNN